MRNRSLAARRSHLGQGGGQDDVEGLDAEFVLTRAYVAEDPTYFVGAEQDN